MDASFEPARVRSAAAVLLAPLRIASSRAVVQPALRTALIVGTVLNLINQGDALLGAGQLAIGKLLVTYCVPYCVSTYTATRVFLVLQAVAKTPRAGAQTGTVNHGA